MLLPPLLSFSPRSVSIWVVPSILMLLRKSIQNTHSGNCTVFSRTRIWSQGGHSGKRVIEQLILPLKTYLWDEDSSRLPESHRRINEDVGHKTLLFSRVIGES